VGNSIVYNSSLDKIHVTYLSGITLYIIDKNSNSLVWQDVLSGQPPGLYISGLSYSPNPIPSGTSYLATFTAYVIYNLNTNQIPTVYLNLTSVKGTNVTMNYVGPLTFQVVTQVGPVNPGVYNIKVYAKTNTSSTNRVFQLNFQLTSGSYGLTITSVSLENLQPLHLSNDQIFVSIYNPSSKAESFQLIYTDSYKGTSTKINTSTGNPSPTFTIQPFTSITVTTTWLGVGGSGPASGVHILYVNFTNVTPFVPSKGGNISLTVLPKILLIDDEGISPNSPKSVLNFYTNMFIYTSYSVDLQILSPNQLANIAGYDLLIWITGYTGVIGSSQSSQISGFINNGGSVLLISNNSNSYSYLGLSVSKINPSNPNNIKYGNFTNPSVLVNITCNVNYPSGTISAVTFSGSGINALANFNGYTLPSVVYGITGKGGRFTYIGYEFSSMYVYQQDYVMNKIIMWLSNIGIRYGNDLALTDLKISPTSPYFMQNVTLSFIIINYSPKALTDVSFEVLIDNAPIGGQPIYTINYINGNGTFIMFNLTWQATTPGVHSIYAYVNPFHTIPEVNYNNNALSSLVNTSLFVKYSTLVIWVHGNNDKNYNITTVTNTLKNMGIAYKFLEYNEQSNTNPPNINSPSSPYFFLKYNLVIVDFNRTGDLSSTWGNVLANAIYNYINNKNATKYPYSLLILGENAGNAINSNSTIKVALQMQSIYTTKLTQSQQVYLYGNNNNTPYLNLGYFGMNVTRGYGILYNFKNVITTLSCNNYYSLNILTNKGNTYAILENISYVMTGIIPLSIENINGIIQEHTYQFYPNSGALSAKYLLMLNLLGSFHYAVNFAVPEVLGADMSINSNTVMVGQYYILSGIIRNLGSVPFSAIVNAYDGSQLFNTQSVYVPALTAVPVKFIWQPQYPAPQNNPRHIRLVISNINAPQFSLNSGIQPFNLLQEGIIDTQVYIFYDDFSTTSYFTQDNVVWAFSGVNYYGTSKLYSASPYSVFGPVSNLFSNINPYYWFWTNAVQTPSGGYALGTSYYLVNSNAGYDLWDSTNGYASAITINLPVHGANYVHLDLDAEFELSNGGEGVIVFASPAGNSNWYWISPTVGYPGNVYVGGILPSNYIYPQNNANLVPAFTLVSGGEHMSFIHYTFNLTQAFASWGISLTSTSAVSIRFVLVIASDSYNTNIYGNDSFYMDNVKVVENGPLIGTSINGDVWSREYDSSIGYYMYNSMYQYELDEMISTSISMANVIWAKLDFLTMYNIWARFSYAGDISDVPNGFNLYVGALLPDGGINWYQIDTRWAGEAGIVPSWAWASTIPSVYYSPGYAFHQIGNDINLTGFIGYGIYLKFLVHGDFPTQPSTGEGYHGKFGLVQSISGNDWVAFTKVIIIGYSPIGVVNINYIWT
jgi:hypothetical protein